MAKDEDDPALQPMIEWATSAPRADLAVEIMGVLGTGGELKPYSTRDIEDRLFPMPTERPSFWSGSPETVKILQQVTGPVREALQLLEHAELVYGYLLEGQPFWFWSPTQLGLAIRATGKAAVGQRIKDRTGL